MRIEDMLRVISSSILPSVVSNEGVEGLRIAATAQLSASCHGGRERREGYRSLPSAESLSLSSLFSP
jgi:hypothetical protein